MITYSKRLQMLFHEYEKQLGGPGNLREVVTWGLEHGRIDEPDFDPIAALVNDMKNALRSETRVDEKGIEYRANAAVRFTSDGGIQESLWGDVDRSTTPPDFMHEHFAQRRKGIFDDCVKLKADVDHYNSASGKRLPFQLVLDFTEDVAEREAMRDGQDDAAE